MIFIFKCILIYTLNTLVSHVVFILIYNDKSKDLILIMILIFFY